MDFEIVGEIRQIETISAEIHWYQADNIGKREFKIKLPFLD